MLKPPEELKDPVYCEKMSCWLCEKACVARYMNALVGAAGANSMKPGACDYNCKVCKVGKKLAKRINKDELREYRMGMRSTRSRYYLKMMAEKKTFGKTVIINKNKV